MPSPKPRKPTAAGPSDAVKPAKKPAIKTPIRRRKSDDPLLDLMLGDLKRSGLGPEDAAAMRLQPGDLDELQLLGLPVFQSYVIPYLDIKGEPTKFRRWRYLEDTRTSMQVKAEKKALRYVQTGDTMPELYFPPQVDWMEAAKDVTTGIVITEGEKKAAAVCKAGLACIGLGGVYSFKSNKRKLPLIQDFYLIDWKDRDVVIAYDSDAHTNHMVIAARNELARELQALGAIPRIAEVPPSEDGEKQGIDDMIVAEGAEAALGCLAEAKTYASSAALHDLNSEVAYVRDPGIVVRMEDGFQMRSSDFTGHAYANRHYHDVTMSFTKDGAPVERMVKKKAAQAWLEWEHRYELAAMAYEPGLPKVTEDMRLNTWRGWGCEPKKGSIKPWRDHLKRLFGADTEMAAWFERWLAMPLQRPGVKMFSCVLLWGAEEGTGKSLIGTTMGRIYGQNYTLLTDKELGDGRNEWVIGKQFVLGDDVTGHENRKHAERLKVIITQEKIRIDKKYVPSYELRDVLNYLFTSNRPDAFFLDDNNRRNFVWEVPASAKMTKAQVAEYFAWLDGEGKAALFHHLLELDLGDMEPSDPAPWTEAKGAMAEDSSSALGGWIIGLKRSPDETLVLGDAKLSGDLWSSRDLLRVYDPEERKGVTMSAVSREMKRAGFGQAYKGMPLHTPKGQQRLFVVRNADTWLKESGPKCSEHYAATRCSAKAKKFG